MRALQTKPEREALRSKAAKGSPESTEETLASLHANPRTELLRADVEARRKNEGFNEVAEKQAHPVLMFVRKFWGISAWMLELIMVLSAVLGKYSDLAIVGALLVVNAVLGFTQEHRAAGGVEALRRRLQVSARVLRDSTWQLLPARELVPGDIVRMRSGELRAQASIVGAVLKRLSLAPFRIVSVTVLVPDLALLVFDHDLGIFFARSITSDLFRLFFVSVTAEARWFPCFLTSHPSGCFCT